MRRVAGLPIADKLTIARRSTAARSARELELHGRVALVTGAGVRVGRAIAEELARAGASVAVHYARSQRGARATEAAIARVQSRVHGTARDRQRDVATRELPGVRLFQADLRADGACERLVADVTEWGRRLDILVCSAAGFERRPFEQIDIAAWRAMMTLNLEAPFQLAQAAAPALRRRRGVIVNILDVAAFHAWKGYAHYAASKAGLAMLTRVLALELAPRVRVCGVAPGTVMFPVDYPRSARADIIACIPLGRVGRPSDIASAVRYLSSAGYVTGAVIPVDGGRMAGTRGRL